MDSLTQIALGATVAHAVMGRQAGRRALVWGAALGTLPDLDVLIPFSDPVAAMTYHRSASHSLIVLTLLTPLLAWLARRLHPDLARHRGRWLLLVWLVLVTHVLLDALTVYGTQLFWPLTDHAVSGSVIFIVDPLYTVPLLVGMVAAWRHRTDAAGHRAALLALAVSTLYLAWAGGAKLWVEHQVREDLARRGAPTAPLLSVPTPFNTLLWRVVVMTEDGYREGFLSLLDGGEGPTWLSRHSDTSLLAPLADHWPVPRLLRFTQGFCQVHEDANGRVILTDLRMGMLDQYFFAFAVGQRTPTGNIEARPSQRVAASAGSRDLGWIARRLIHADTPWPTATTGDAP